MIISHRHRCIFVDVPVAAGDSLRSFLSVLLEEEDVAVGSGVVQGRSNPDPLPRHAGAVEIRAWLEQGCWDAYFKFAFIRNPWELRVAEFLSAQGEAPPAQTSPAALVDRQSGFEDYLLSPDRPRYGYADYLCDIGGELLLDFVGRYESLEQDISLLLERLELTAQDRDRPAFEFVAEYASYYNFLTRDLIASEFQADLSRFDYCFNSGADSVFARRRAPAHLIGHFSHHKAGTVWFQRVLKKLAQRQGWKFQSCMQQDLDSDTQIFMQENSRVELDSLPPYRASHVIRDPRDMIVSGYFYHLWCDEAWCVEARDKFGGQSYRQVLNSVSREQGIEMEIERCQSTLKRMAQWDYGRPELVEVRFEDMLADQYAVFARVFEHYGLSAQQIDIGLSVVEQCDFERTTGRKKGQEAEQSHLRKGVAGDWRNHFTRDHVKQFKSSCPGLLERFGYEIDDDWQSNS